MGNCVCCCTKDYYRTDIERNVSDEKLGFYLLPFPQVLGCRTTVKRALYQAERKKGGPCYFVEVYREWLRISYMPMRHFFIVNACLSELYRNDEIMADEEYNLFSMNPAL